MTRFPLTGLLLLALAPALAAREPSPVRLPCAEAVRLGLDRYVARYTAAAHDASTAGDVAACDAYARCRRRLNDAAARRLPPARRAQVARARQALDALASACWEYTYAAAGGGTMWSVLEAGDQGRREEFLARLIADLRRPAPPAPAARRQAREALESANRALAGLATPSAAEFALTDADFQRRYRTQTYPAARAAFVHLGALTASLPDAPARRLAREVRRIVTAPAKNLRVVR